MIAGTRVRRTTVAATSSAGRDGAAPPGGLAECTRTVFRYLQIDRGRAAERERRGKTCRLYSRRFSLTAVIQVTAQRPKVREPLVGLDQDGSLDQLQRVGDVGNPLGDEDVVRAAEPSGQAGGDAHVALAVVIASCSFLAPNPAPPKTRNG
jgi:hypothetical protein